MTDKELAEVQDCARIEPTVIHEEYVRYPADLARWNALYADAYERLARAEHARKSVQGRIHLEIRTRERILSDEEAVKNPKAKVRLPTVADLEALVEQSPEVLAARLEELEADCEKVRVGLVLEALRAKKDMLVSLGAHIRAEMAGDPVLRDQVRGAGEARRGW